MREGGRIFRKLKAFTSTSVVVIAAMSDGAGWSEDVHANILPVGRGGTAAGLSIEIRRTAGATDVLCALRAQGGFLNSMWWVGRVCLPCLFANSVTCPWLLSHGPLITQNRAQNQNPR